MELFNGGGSRAATAERRSGWLPFLNLSSQEGNACIQRKISNAAGSLSLVKSKKLWPTGWPRIFIYKIGLGSCRCLAQLKLPSLFCHFPGAGSKCSGKRCNLNYTKERYQRKIFASFCRGFNAWQAEREVSLLRAAGIFTNNCVSAPCFCWQK
jgi:hypothetical protein